MTLLVTQQRFVAIMIAITGAMLTLGLTALWDTQRSSWALSGFLRLSGPLEHSAAYWELSGLLERSVAHLNAQRPTATYSGAHCRTVRQMGFQRPTCAFSGQLMRSAALWGAQRPSGTLRGPLGRSATL